MRRKKNTHARVVPWCPGARAAADDTRDTGSKKEDKETEDDDGKGSSFCKSKQVLPMKESIAFAVLALALTMSGTAVSLSFGPRAHRMTALTQSKTGGVLSSSWSSSSSSSSSNGGSSRSIERSHCSSRSSRSRSSSSGSSFALRATADGEKEDSGVEPKYLVALGVFFLACVYDFFVMHNGVPIWEIKDGVLTD